MEKIKEGYYEFNLEILNHWRSKGYKSIMSQMIVSEVPYEFLEESAFLITPSIEAPHEVDKDVQHLYHGTIPDYIDINHPDVDQLTIPIDLTINVVREEHVNELI